MNQKNSAAVGLRQFFAFMLPLSLAFSGTALPYTGGAPLYAVELVLAGYCVAALLSNWRQLKVGSVSIETDLKVLLLWLGIGAVTGVMFAETQRIGLGSLKSWILAPLVFTYVLLRFKEDQKWVLQGLVAFVGLEFLVGLPQVLGGDRLRGTLLSPNYLAMMILPVVVYVGTQVLAGERKIGTTLVLLLGLVTLLLTGSVSALLALVVVGVVSVLQQKMSPTVKRFLVCCLAVVFICAAVILAMRLQQGPVNSIASRWEIWQVAERMISYHPFSGVGFRGFASQYVTMVAPVLHRAPIEWLVPQPHSLFFAFWLNMGMGGLIFYLLIVQHAISRVLVKMNEALPLLALLILGLFDTPFFKTEVVYVFALTLVWSYLGTSIQSSVASRKTLD